MTAANGLELQQLLLLETIAECGSMAKAAARLDKVPSALSYQVRRLEDELDLLLVDRRKGKARLTEAALLLVREGQAVRIALDDALARARRVALGYEAELVIAVDAVVPATALWPLLRSFDKLRAPTQLRFWQEVMSGSWEALLAGRADLVIGAPGDAPAHSEVRTALLGQIEFCFCVAPDHPLAMIGQPLTPHQIARHRAVAVADSARAAARRTVGLLPGQPVLTVPDFHYKLDALRAGLGCGYLPKHLAQADLDAGRLLHKPTAQASVPAPLYLAWREPVRGQALSWFIHSVPNAGIDRVLAGHR